MPFTVYLSSTLQDLEPERRAVQDALRDLCVVKHSYQASEDALVESCLDDVAGCDVYIGILGLRYGHVPTHRLENPDRRSITELEYHHAAAHGIPRLVFLKDENTVLLTQSDYRSQEHPPARIEAFRATVEAEQRPARFASITELREQVIKAFNAFKETHDRSDSIEEPPASALSNERLRQAYVAWLRRECEKVVLLGLDLRDRQNVRLAQVYVPALTPGLSRESPTGSSHHAVGFEGEPLLRRLGDESLYVPGSPGSGKSTFCRWVALAVAGGALPSSSVELPHNFVEQLPDSLGGRFPFLLPLRQWASDQRWLAGNGQWSRQQLEDALASWVDATRPGGLTASAFLEVLHRGRCVLLLDGVDEIPKQVNGYYARSNFLTGLADALPQWTSLDHRVLLTSRPHGIEDAERRNLGLSQAALSALPRELQEVFVQRWFNAVNGDGSTEKARALVAHLDDRPDLCELRPNPMLLTALCVKYDEDLRLPGDLYRLYSAVTDQVLYKRFPTEAERDLAKLRLSAIALAMHTGSTRHPRMTPAAEVSFDEVDDALAELARTDRTSEQSSRDASEKREDLLSRSGLLLARPNRRAAFYHLSFQEFFAAERLRRTAADTRTVVAEHMAASEWRRTLRFLFCAVADQSSPERALADYNGLLERLHRNDLVRDPDPAMLLAECLEVGHARGWTLNGFGQPFRRACEDALAVVDLPGRAHLWRVLGRIGLDDRPGVGVQDGTPDIAWIEIPDGPFVYGEDLKEVRVPAFRIARYPITNKQFQAFVADGGYECDAWWQQPRPPGPTAPEFSAPTLARGRVSWFEAMAFCAWLASRLRSRGMLTGEQQIRLPTEQEWEKAANVMSRQKPWHRERDSRNAIARGLVELVAKTNRPVGITPSTSSPVSADDMTTGLLEWCLNGDHPGDGLRTLRGGADTAGSNSGLGLVRLRNIPDECANVIVFRVVLASADAAVTRRSVPGAMREHRAAGRALATRTGKGRGRHRSHEVVLPPRAAT